MDNAFATIFVKTSMWYHKIKPYDIIESNCSLDIRQYLMENFNRFLDDCKMLLSTYLIKTNDLLTTLNSKNNDIQFSMQLSDDKLPILEILITKSDNQIWINIYSKPTDLKRCFLTF